MNDNTKSIILTFFALSLMAQGNAGAQENKASTSSRSNSSSNNNPGWQKEVTQSTYTTTHESVPSIRTSFPTSVGYNSSYSGNESPTRGESDPYSSKKTVPGNTKSEYGY